MTATTFDTLTVARDLEAAGFERRQAEAIAKAVHHRDEHAITKADLDTAIDGVRSEVASVRSEVASVRSELASLRSELATVRWVVGIQSAVTLATFAIVAAKLL